jgi:hypothetical protein
VTQHLVAANCRILRIARKTAYENLGENATVTKHGFESPTGFDTLGNVPGARHRSQAPGGLALPALLP